MLLLLLLLQVVVLLLDAEPELLQLLLQNHQLLLVLLLLERLLLLLLLLEGLLLRQVNRRQRVDVLLLLLLGRLHAAQLFDRGPAQRQKIFVKTLFPKIFQSYSFDAVVNSSSGPRLPQARKKTHDLHWGRDPPVQSPSHERY